MTNTRKVQGFLAVFGNWDATLAFVLAGAILPMAVAWRLAARRKASVLGFALPAPPGRKIDMGLVAGALRFGIGWAVAGPCPARQSPRLVMAAAAVWSFFWRWPQVC